MSSWMTSKKNFSENPLQIDLTRRYPKLLLRVLERREAASGIAGKNRYNHLDLVSLCCLFFYLLVSCRIQMI